MCKYHNFMGRTNTYDDVDADGYVTVYGASHGHIDYLDELAITNGLRRPFDLKYILFCCLCARLQKRWLNLHR